MHAHHLDTVSKREADQLVYELTDLLSSGQYDRLKTEAAKTIERYAPELLTADRSQLQFSSRIRLLGSGESRVLSAALNKYAHALVAIIGSNATVEDRVYYIKLYSAASRLTPGNVSKRFDLVSMVHSTIDLLDRLESNKLDAHAELREELLNFGLINVHKMLGKDKQERARVMMGHELAQDVAQQKSSPNILAFGVNFAARLAELGCTRGEFTLGQDLAGQGLRFAQLIREIFDLPGKPRELKDFEDGQLKLIVKRNYFILKVAMLSELKLLRLLKRDQDAENIERLLALTASNRETI